MLPRVQWASRGQRKHWEKRVPGVAGRCWYGDLLDLQVAFASQALPIPHNSAGAPAQTACMVPGPWTTMSTDLRALSGPTLHSHPTPALPLPFQSWLPYFWSCQRSWHYQAWWASPQKEKSQDFGSLWVTRHLLTHHMAVCTVTFASMWWPDSMGLVTLQHTHGLGWYYYHSRLINEETEA